MIKTREKTSRRSSKYRSKKSSSSRWKQRTEARRAARARSGAVRKGASRRSASRKRTSFRKKARPRVGRILSGLASDNTSLPTWHDISSDNNRPSTFPQAEGFLERLSTGRFVIMLVLAALAATLYVGHIHATQTLVADLEQAKRQNMELHLQHNRLRGDFDRMTGPAVIAERARELGLEEDIAYRPAITMSTP